MGTKQAQQRQNEKRRNTPRLPIVYTTQDIIQKLDYLAEKHGSKKAAIEAAICALYDEEKSLRDMVEIVGANFCSNQDVKRKYKIARELLEQNK